MSEFNQKSYDLQKDLIDKRVEEEAYPLEPFFDKSLPKYYTHTLMMESLDPLISKGSTWASLGDMWGREAAYINEKGGDCIATDLSTAWLGKTKALGHIEKYQEENAEKLTFEDKSLDYVLMKDTYHHCPRPYMAMYEMLRVSTKAAVIVESVDMALKMPWLMAMYNIMDRINPKLAGKIHKNRYSFEFVGNFVYKTSERELEKLALGINLPMIAFRRFNKVLAKDALKKRPLTKIKMRKRIVDLGSSLGLYPTSHICAVLFNEKPSEELIARMKKAGYIFPALAKNPYV